MGGKIVPNYSVNFPKSTIQSAIAINIGTLNTDTSSWAKYYNFPETGLAFFGSNLGNNKIYGNQFSISPYIQFKLNNKPKPFYIKLAIGASYFTTHFDSISNTDNVAIGSGFTWDFQAFLYKSIYHNNGVHLRLGGGYSHASNGHTQLPNFGLNSGLISIAAQFYNPKNEVKEPSSNVSKRKSKNLFLNFRQGIGFHELGATAEPVGGTKREIYTSALSLGIIFNQHLKIRSGFAYRYYEQYNNYIKETENTDFIDNPTLSSSNVYFFIGSEFLMGHIGLDVMGGLNLYKPFYKEFNTVYEKNEGVKYYLKKLFTTRMGLNLYLLNTTKQPTHNAFIGTHINANFGQADFTEINLGYQFNFN
ncbi:MAG: acyloxyacyl hydrolase [Flavobacteriales bacterium]|nr:acyloxyacyl hydrolase [Flavobacteriales bacterium]